MYIFYHDEVKREETNLVGNTIIIEEIAELEKNLEDKVPILTLFLYCTEYNFCYHQ
jgi:hypothetical protein